MFKNLSKPGVGPKIIISVSLALGLLFLGEIIISNTIILNSFSNIEQQDMTGDIQRVQGLLNDQILNYNIKIYDWTVWDDTYKFVQDKNQTYIDANLLNNTFSSLRTNFMFFIASSGAIVYEKGVDINSGKDIPIPADLIAFLSKPNKVTVFKTTDESSSGIVRLTDKFLLFASRPIVKSNGDGPIMGTMVMGRYLDNDLLAYLAKLNHSKVDFQDFYSKLTEKDYIDAKNALTPQNKYFVEAVSANEIAGFTIVNDFDNKPAFILENELQRPFYIQGNTTVNFFMFLFLAGSTLGLISGLYAINRFLVSKITGLNKDVNKLRDPNSLIKRLNAKGSDEFAALAGNINLMLDEIKKSEENLTEFKLAIDNTSDHVVMTDPNLVITYINRGAEKMTGYTKEELIGKNPHLWMQKEYIDKIHEVISKKQPFNGKIINKRKNGELYPVEASITPILDDKGEIKFHVGIERDISSEKILEDSYAKIEAKTASLEQSQKALANVLEDERFLEENLKKEKEGVEQKIEERTKELLIKNVALTQAKEEISKGWFQVQTEKARLLASVTSIPLGFIMFDNEGKLLLKNPSFEKILGITSYYPDIDSIDSLLGNEFSIKDKFIKCMSDKQTIDVKEMHYKGVYLHLFFAPVISSDQSRSSLGVILLIQDITEAKIAERSKDEFFSIASHELRTPLTAIRGNTSLIKQYYGDKLVDKDLAEMIDDIHASSERLIEIVNDFLNVSRLEQGKMVFKKEAVNLVELTQSVIKEYQTTGSLKMLYLKFAPPSESIPKVYADNDKTRQIIINLIGNSLKYTEKGGVIVSIEANENFVKLLVSDTGRGIEKDQQNLLFRKFQQTERSILTRDTTQGTGLGLYISKLMIEGMGGKIALEKSEPNVGSVFSFALPIGGEHAQSA